MSWTTFCCPVCKGPLEATTARLRCASCGRDYEIVDGIPDFFISEAQEERIDDPNKTWLDPIIVQARDTAYRLCAHELKGMAFCMQEISRRTGAGCRILEVGMGTGHFTRWMAEAAKPGTEIYAFDFSWPIIEKARANTRGLSGVMLFRANARAQLPFEDEGFDILFLRLAPLGAHGTPRVRAAFELLKPGGWYFEAGWEPTRYETPPTEWALQHGYENAEYHVWQYYRRQTEQEVVAMQVERECLISMGCESVGAVQVRESDAPNHEGQDGSVLNMTCERFLVAQKPGSG